jgi:plasmid stabilization system protein ParE
MKLRFAKAVKDDLREMLAFIDAQGLRRGGRLRDELRQCLSDIKNHPMSWPRLFRRVRIRIMKRFGSGIYYEYDEARDEVFVGAITHLKRKSSFWKRRFAK